MLGENRPALTLAIALVLALALITGAQALAAASAPPLRQSSQAAVIGQAGFAYIGGLRMMAAGLLWGRLDPQFHQYGGLAKIQDRLDLLPSIQMVQLLNPQLEYPYYYSSYVMYLRHRMGDALEIAREGVRNNPTSGLLRANYAQLLMIQDKKANLPVMLEQARAGLAKNATYNSVDDEFESFAVFRVTYQLAGDQAKVKAIKDAQAQLDALQPPAQQSGSGGFAGAIASWANSASDTGDNASGPATSTAIVK